MKRNVANEGAVDSVADAARRYRRAVAAAVACNIVEFFDFVTYAFFAVQIGLAFFPPTDSRTSLLLSMAVFGVGFLSRPMGSIVIGYYADRKGRRPALILTAAMMAVGTLGIAVLPGYTAIGIAAPVLVTIFRMLQGFALGGEIGPSVAFLLEVSSYERRASAVSLQIASQGAASALAAAIGCLLIAYLDSADMAGWGWRIPFGIGALLIPIAWYLRLNMPETRDISSAISAPVGAPGQSWLDRRVVLGIGVIAGGTVSTYVGNYMATYSTAVLKLPQIAGLMATMAIGIATIAGALVGGRLADKLGRWPVMFWPRLGVAVLCVPAFTRLLAQPSLGLLLTTSAVLAFLTAANGSGALTTICELFPPRNRAMGLALSYSISVSVFGGTTQFLVTWLIVSTGSPIAPAWYILGTSVVALLATLLLPETSSRGTIAPSTNPIAPTLTTSNKA